MGLFSKLLGIKEEPAIEKITEKNTLYLPVEGEVISLEAIGDGVFSEGILGLGCGIQPVAEIVYAPANGTVTQIADTKHAVGLMSNDGIEVLIHVGMDTVEMNGDGFIVLVKNGEKVKCGQPLLKFSMDKIKDAGHSTTTAFVVTNADDFSTITILNAGNAQKLMPTVKVER